MLAEQVPEPATGEHLVLCGDSGNYFTTTDTSDRKWFGLTGFLAGRFWLLHLFTGKSHYRDAALRTSLLHRHGTVSSLINETLSAHYGPALGFEITADPRLSDLALATCDELVADFWEPLEVFLRWPTGPGRPDRAFMQRLWNAELDEYVGTVDETASASILCWARAFRPNVDDYLLRAQRALRRHGLLDEDGRILQAVSADAAGQNVRVGSLQGSRLMSRPQAWGILSAVAAYEASGDDEFLRDARAAADFYIREIVADGDPIPPYDRSLDGSGFVPRDTCCAAIAATALIRLVQAAPSLSSSYMPFVERTLTELIERHLSPGGTLLHGCWGSLSSGAREHVMPFGNYFLVEAIMRLLAPELEVWRRWPTHGAAPPT